MQSKLWSEDEVELLRACVNAGYTHNDIGIELNRTPSAIKQKSCALKIKSNNTNIWSKDEIIFLIECLEAGWLYREIGKEINRSSDSIYFKLQSLNLASKNNKVLTNDIVDNRLKNRDIELVDNYITNKIHIKFKCLQCNNIWKAKPDNVLNKHSGCPKCTKYGFKENKASVTYLIYFKELDLYKIGITNNFKRRLTEFGYKPEIIFIRKFELGIDAKNLESQWLYNIMEYKVNTNKLLTGNTETFRYGN